ncbi:hypothetical protein DUNSADRAFT_14084 [Dunaliella salina]|uniref:Uncharacterized protein n=1 Tax=Dunaliella salina TaxID=3046 RepID=A0ABQ7G878_DUNSA|nr:hypothetical protein DUNSADRAFT_14084 [Dunaliella salina]|eukprot:KAF5830764.1 hypothetical protein DUNSADRAFT_14084 [Dunaliella salina]
MGAPATALSLFYLTGLIILIQLLMARNRNTFYMVIVVLAAWAEGGGYSAAVYTVQNDCKKDLFDSFLAAQVIILLVPNFIEATMYTSASRVTAFGRAPREHFWQRPAFVTWFYTVSDITADEYDPDQATVGAWIVVAGLIAQIVSQAIFFLEQLYLQTKIDKEYAELPETRAMYFSIYWIWAFLQIRNIYRLVAFIQRSVANKSGGGGGGAGSIQPAFFILEALMILMSCLVFAIYPPGWLLPRASAKKVEMQAERVQAGQVVEKDIEKEGYDEDSDLNAPAEIPDSIRNPHFHLSKETTFGSFRPLRGKTVCLPCDARRRLILVHAKLAPFDPWRDSEFIIYES